jgi:hypothetical protein
MLEGIKNCLLNITTIHGFNFNVKDVVRRFVFFDQISSFPYLMVLGGDEPFEDTFGTETLSRLRVRVAGYAKSAQEPEKEQCKLIEDVLSCLDNTTYNTKKKYMRPIGIETDEGMLHVAGEGLSMFVLSLEMTYKFSRSDP